MPREPNLALTNEYPIINKIGLGTTHPYSVNKTREKLIPFTLFFHEMNKNSILNDDQDKITYLSTLIKPHSRLLN